MKLTRNEKRLIQILRGLDQRGQDRVYHVAASEERYIRLEKKRAERVESGVKFYHANR